MTRAQRRWRKFRLQLGRVGFVGWIYAWMVLGVLADEYLQLGWTWTIDLPDGALAWVPWQLVPHLPVLALAALILYLRHLRNKGEDDELKGMRGALGRITWAYLNIGAGGASILGGGIEVRII